MYLPPTLRKQMNKEDLYVGMQVEVNSTGESSSTVFKKGETAICVSVMVRGGYFVSTDINGGKLGYISAIGITPCVNQKAIKNQWMELDFADIERRAIITNSLSNQYKPSLAINMAQGGSHDEQIVSLGFPTSNTTENRIVKNIKILSPDSPGESLKTPMQKLGYKVGDKVVYLNSLWTIEGDDRANSAYFTLDSDGYICYLPLKDVIKYDGNYLKLKGISIGDVVINTVETDILHKGGIYILESSLGLSKNSLSYVSGGTKTDKPGALVNNEWIRKATVAEVKEYLQRVNKPVEPAIVKLTLSE